MSAESLRIIEVEPFKYAPPPKIEDLHDKASQILAKYGKTNPIDSEFEHTSLLVALSSSLVDQAPSELLALESINRRDLFTNPDTIHVMILSDKYDFGGKSQVEIAVRNGRGVAAAKPFTKIENVEIMFGYKEMKAMKTRHSVTRSEATPQELRKVNSLLDFVAFAAEQKDITQPKS